MHAVSAETKTRLPRQRRRRLNPAGQRRAWSPKRGYFKIYPPKVSAACFFCSLKIYFSRAFWICCCSPAGRGGRRRVSTSIPTLHPDISAKPRKTAAAPNSALSFKPNTSLYTSQSILYRRFAALSIKKNRPAVPEVFCGTVPADGFSAALKTRNLA